MKTQIVTPTFDDLAKLDLTVLKNTAEIAELAIAKPYFLDRLKVAIELKEGKI